MAELSLCMIVKNEEDTLGNCLKSIGELADEIIIVDTGSTDATKEIAAKFTDKIYDFKWIDDFSAARNYAFSLASKEYVFWLDADDILTEKDLIEAIKIKKILNGTQSQVVAKYNVDFDKLGNVTLCYNRERIFKRSENFKWIGAIHEVIPIANDALYSDFAVTHNKIHPTEKGRNLRIFEKLIKDGQTLDARQLFYYGRELYYNGKYTNAIEVMESFLKCPDAWLENRVSACLNLSECYNKIGNRQEALSSLTKSFAYDKPRSEICCAIGQYFMEENRYDVAAQWYYIASQNVPNTKSGGFINLDCYGYIPNIQLCVCYDRLKDYEKAEIYNEQAALFKPESEAVISNRKYFKKLKKAEK